MRIRKKILFNYTLSKFFHPKEKREKGMHLHGASESGKSTLFQVFIKLYGKENIGVISQNAGAFETEFLTDDKRMFIFDEYSPNSKFRSYMLKILEGGDIITNGKWKDQKRVVCNKNTVIISNKKVSFGKSEYEDNGLEYDPNEAINTRLEYFKMKKIENADKKYILEIQNEIPSVVFLCNDNYFKRKATKKKTFPIDEHPKIISLLEEKKREMRKRKYEELQEEEEWLEDKEEDIIYLK